MKKTHAVKPSILVVEDEELLLKAITHKLTLSGFEPVSCVAGSQAIHYLEEFPELPHAIWLDYYLKDMNGLEFMKKVRENPKWKHIPIMVVSNSADPTNLHNMMALGVSRYLLKAEHRLEDIISAIREFVSQENALPSISTTE